MIPRTPKIELNEQFQKALELLENSSQSVFITGKAGTGKSTLLDYFRGQTKKNVVVLAPTGVAALNIHGQTIHSFFGFKPDITLEKVERLNPSWNKAKICKNLQTLVIDEISMVRADILDCVDKFLRLNGPDKNLPFGGIQMVFIGDLYQLPPVVSRDEEEIFHLHYKSPYFFDAQCLENFPLGYIELEKIYRQADQQFISILNAIRTNTLTYDHLETLNSRLNFHLEVPQNNFYIHLTVTNKRAEEINEECLSRLPGYPVIYQGNIWGDFDQNALPTGEEIALKKGGQIMMLNNDREGRWVNGTLGKILDIHEEEDGDIILIETEDGREEEVTPFTWEIFKFAYDEKSRSLRSEIVGSFTQYPLKLAWAVTIHKSQGKTFDRVVIDIGRGTFAHGQMYVALSRCKTLEGIILKTPIQRKDIIVDPRVNYFFQRLNPQENTEVKLFTQYNQRGDQ